MSKERIGSIKDYTPNYKLIIPRFNLATWHDYIEENFRNIDALFFNLFGINNYSGSWKQVTEYKQGQVLFIGDDLDTDGNVTDFSGRLVKVLVDHVTDNSVYFNIFYKLHPNYYELFADASTAQKFAQQAQQSAANALSSEQKAKQSEINAKNSENVAIQKANEASTSASNAKTSETNAKSYELSALNSKNAAKSSQDAAKVSETNAAQSVTTQTNNFNTYNNELIVTKNQGLVELRNKTNDGLSALANSSDALTKSNITNCITEIPQDIKLDLADSTLTLKAGSKVYVPNGEGNYNAITISADKSTKTTGSAKMFLCTAMDGSSLFAGYMTGGTITSWPASPIKYAVYYYTPTNVCAYYNGSSWVQISFPIAVVTRGSSGFESIDQVFNGFGYIGSTVFTLPGVKGLIPNGRNTNGSLKNIEFTTSNVLTTTLPSFNVASAGLWLSNTYLNGVLVRYGNVGASGYVTIDEENNLNLGTSGQFYAAYVGNLGWSTTGITSLSPKIAFHAVDYNDYAREVDNTVHKTGNETIYNRKTFDGSGIGIIKSGSAIDIQNKNVDLSVVDGSVHDTSEIHFLDKNGKVQGIFEHQNRTNGDSVIIMAARNHANTAWITMEAGFNKNDTAFTNAPNPPSGSNNNAIATTAWVRKYGAQLDYSAAITISGTGEKTASVNGVLIGTPINTNSSEQLKIIIGGKTFFFTPGNSGEDNTHLSQCYLPVAKGQAYNVVEINNNVQLLLVPYV